jgi:hypothetical protein
MESLVCEESKRHFLIDNITPSAYKNEVDKDPYGICFFLKIGRFTSSPSLLMVEGSVEKKEGRLWILTFQWSKRS